MAGSHEPFPVEPALGNVALARKHLSPAIPVAVLHSVPVEEEPGEVILHVDIHCLAAFDEGIEECHEAFLPFKRVCRNDGEYAFRHGRYGVFTAEFKDSFKERPEDPSEFSQIFVIEEEIACKSPVSEQSFLMEEVGIKPDFRSPKEFRTELGQAL